MREQNERGRLIRRGEQNERGRRIRREEQNPRVEREINSVRPSNGSRRTSAEYVRYTERASAEEFSRVQEAHGLSSPSPAASSASSSASSAGAARGAADARKNAAAIQRLLATAVVATVVTVGVTDVVPILKRPAVILREEFSVSDTAIDYEVEVGDYTEGDELSVAVYNDFVREEQSVREPRIAGRAEGLQPKVRYFSTSCAYLPEHFFPCDE